jgi:hypothetical protein
MTVEHLLDRPDIVWEVRSTTPDRESDPGHALSLHQQRIISACYQTTVETGGFGEGAESGPRFKLDV